MEISMDLVNNELLSTLIFAFAYCYTLHIIVSTFSNFFSDLFDYLDERSKKKKTNKSLQKCDKTI